MFGNKPKIRTKTVLVKTTPSTSTLSSPHTTNAAHAPRPHAVKSRTAAGPPANRYKVTPSAQAKPREPQRTTLTVSRVQKRKVSPSTPQWASSDDESDEDDDDRLGKRPRTRPASNSTEPMNLNRTLEKDLARRIRVQWDEKDGETGTKDETEEEKPGKVVKGKLLPGSDMSQGDEAKNYKSAFTDMDKNPILELQYPSPSKPENFEAVLPLDSSEGYSPLDDIYFSIEEIIQHFLPPEMVAELASDTEGTVRLLKRAVTKNSPEDFQAELTKFNKLIKDNVDNGTVARILDEMHAVPLSLVKRITAQSYNRIISPHAHRLRKVKGKETTYGELLPPFVHKIFQQTGLNSSHVFIDLGSGVGNVVLQAALQTGAESWGIEMMDLAASLGTQQAAEFTARAKLWNIALGDLHLLHGDFLETPAIDSVLRRADVLLVNNKVFGEQLNNALLQKFLDLKPGCRVVSLESFGGGAAKGVRHEQAIASLFDEERFESGTNSVSWAGESVDYFIATKAR